MLQCARIQPRHELQNLQLAAVCVVCLQGAKISTLTAAVDERVKALCLWDPVDVTVYAPQSAEYPSAVAALRNVQSNLPVAIVGGGKAGDCVPKDSNYRCLTFNCSHNNIPVWSSRSTVEPI